VDNRQRMIGIIPIISFWPVLARSAALRGGGFGCSGLPLRALAGRGAGCQVGRYFGRIGLKIGLLSAVICYALILLSVVEQEQAYEHPGKDGLNSQDGKDHGHHGAGGSV
jgi:hypothetical protein